MSTIRLTGLASGLDTDSIITSLMSLERAPRTRMALQQTAAQARQTGLQAVRSDLNALKLAAADLRSAALWGDTQSVESADTTKITARRTSGAGPGGYEVTVSQMAAAERRTFDFQSSSSASQLTIFGSDPATARATIDLPAGATLDDAVAAINSSETAGLFAVNVGEELVLASRTTGTTSAFSVTGAGAELEVVAGQNATGTVGTTPFDSPSNLLTGAIPGVELTLKGKTSSLMVTVGPPAPDRDGVKTKLKAFVDKYNDVVKSMRTELEEKKVPGATSTVDASKGALFGDTGISGILSKLRTTVMDNVQGLTGLASLADIGISTGAPAGGTVDKDAVSGKLKFDEAAFDAALVKDPRAVQRLLAGATSTAGFAQKFEDVLTPLTQSGGVLDGRIEASGSQLTRIKDSLVRFDDRLDRKEALLRKQFTALETAMQRSSSVAADLAARLGTSTT